MDIIGLKRRCHLADFKNTRFTFRIISNSTSEISWRKLKRNRWKMLSAVKKHAVGILWTVWQLTATFGMDPFRFKLQRLSLQTLCARWREELLISFASKIRKLETSLMQLTTYAVCKDQIGVMQRTKRMTNRKHKQSCNSCCYQSRFILQWR